MKRVEKLGLILLLLAFAGAVYVCLPIVEALAFGVALAYVVRPLAYKTRSAIGPFFSSFLSLGVSILLLISFIFYSTGLIIIEANNFMETKQYEKVTEPVNDFLEKNPEAREYFERGTAITVTYFSRQLEDTGQIINNIMGFMNFIVTLLLAVVISFYLLKDGPHLKEALMDIIPSKYLPFVRTAYERLDKDLEMMFVGSLFTALFVWVFTSLVLTYLNVPYSMLVGILSGCLQLLPMVGPQLILVPLGLFLAATGDVISGVVTLALAVALFFFSDTVVRSIISKRTGTVHSLVVLIAFIGGVLAFGIKGVVLGPVIFASLDGLMKAYKELGA